MTIFWNTNFWLIIAPTPIVMQTPSPLKISPPKTNVSPGLVWEGPLFTSIISLLIWQRFFGGSAIFCEVNFFLTFYRLYMFFWGVGNSLEE